MKNSNLNAEDPRDIRNCTARNRGKEAENTGCNIFDWSGDVNIQPEAWEQIERTSRLPFVNVMAVMPDAHFGLGASIGTVIHTVGAAIPSAVGVDIGCGILAYQTDVHVTDIAGKEEALRAYIQETIPTGRTANGAAADEGKWGTKFKVPSVLMDERLDITGKYEAMLENYPKLVHKYVHAHLGTLGSGNHFIEIAVSTKGMLWILVHSGSRGPGAKLAMHWMRRAKELCNQWFVQLEDPDLAYIPSSHPEFSDYWDHTKWAVEYAALNRRMMADLAFQALCKFSGTGPDTRVVQAIDTSHNFIESYTAFGKTGYLTRKGASKSAKGQLSVMPGSMGTKSYIVEGKGHVLSMNSCSHGAGRMMSRREARRQFSLEDHITATEGVFCKKTDDVIDETPMAYKDIDNVLAAQDDLVTVQYTLKAVINVKG